MIERLAVSANLTLMCRLISSVKGLYRQAKASLLSCDFECDSVYAR